MKDKSSWWKKFKSNATKSSELSRKNFFKHREVYPGIMWNKKVFIKIIEVLLCIACTVALRVTDDESRRVFNFLRYRSREWALLNNVTWGTIGAALATATCGGYVIITAGLLLAVATGELRGRKTELFLLGLGVILFGIIGALSLASIENVPNDLIDNAAVLGALCLITGLVFIADILMTTPEQDIKHDATHIFVNKNAGKSLQPPTTLTIEKESKAPKASGHNKTLDSDRNDSVNDTKDTNKDNSQQQNHQVHHHQQEESPAGSREHQVLVTAQRPRVTDVGILAEPNRDYGDDDIKFIDDDQFTKEYSNLRNQFRESTVNGYRDAETTMRDRLRDERDNGRAFYHHTHEMNIRSSDEVDTPRFSSIRDNLSEARFPKIVNSSVKTNRVNRDDHDNFESHGRYLDSSHFDTISTRLAPGIMKRGRDNYLVSSGRSYRSDRSKDGIEMLDEWVGVLRKSTTGTQTTIPSTLPSSPNDPGYVRHTASNWPREIKFKTPGSSPNREVHH
ncbi:Protein of unknown function [Cotesia congregata]|uniref:Uncharacterized protein n=1 Tax=Cotesia congregata TaxID=51543 RepID=A0A8J2HGH9_COTCN|nr:Protein of unknown function [Cotesia congregata]